MTQLDRIEADLAQLKVMLGSLLDALAEDDSEQELAVDLDGSDVGGERDQYETL